MNVGEFIKELEKYPKDLPVIWIENANAEIKIELFEKDDLLPDAVLLIPMR